MSITINHSPFSNLKAIILAGGKSSRMGVDKSQLQYHDLPQIPHLIDLLTQLKIEAFVSLNKAQASSYTETNKIIIDKFDAIGPMGGICSALMAYPKNAWLVLACDMPNITKEHITCLIDNRDPATIASCFILNPTRRIEPLLSIWEIDSLETIKKCIDKKEYSLQKLLKTEHVNFITVNDHAVFKNINTKEDLDKYNKS